MTAVRRALRGALLTRDFVLTGLVLLVTLPVWALPWSFALALGRLYGRLLGAFWPRARRVALINLRRAYGPEMTREHASRLTGEVFASLGLGVAEGVQFARRFKSGRADWRGLYEVEDPELEARILADPRPKVLVTGHLGSWEIAVMLAGLRIGGRGAVIVRRVDNPFLNAAIRRVRLSDEAQWIEKHGSTAEAMRRLRGGESVALLLDENGGARGVFVDFFGRPASTQRTAALLSIRARVPIVVGAAVRRRERLLYRLAMLEPPAERATPADVRALTQEVVSAYERWVREDPDQWRWIHWRWKSRPDGAEETYGRPELARCFAAAEPAAGRAA